MIVIVLRPDSPPMILDDGTTDGKPHAGAIGLGRKEWLEQALQAIGGNASPMVLDTNHNFSRIRCRSADRHTAISRLARVERLEGVAQQVHQNLLNLHFVDRNLRQRGFAFEVQSDVVQSRVGIQQFNHFF